MRRAYLSRSAETDLLEIWVHVAEDSYDAADRLLSLLRAKCQFLARTPRAGRLRDELAPSVRSFPVGKYVIFYRVVPKGIEVARILSGSRGLGAAFRG